MFVDGDFRSRAIKLVDTLWLRDEDKSSQAWLLLTKAAYMLVRRAGYSGFEDHFHNNAGKKAAKLRDKLLDRWRMEADEAYEPREILESIRDFLTR